MKRFVSHKHFIGTACFFDISCLAVEQIIITVEMLIWLITFEIEGSGEDCW